MFIKEITKDQVNQLPLLKYEGKIVVVNTLHALKTAVSEIKAHDAVGIDTETRPAFLKGQFYHVSLVQIAVPEKVYLFRINQTGLADELCDLFADDKIQKIGISIRDDIKALQKKYSFLPHSFVDLNTIAKELEIKNAGVRNLTAIFLESRISKNQQTSNWEKDVLTEQQIRYAATDAWVCLEIYNKLKQLGYIYND